MAYRNYIASAPDGSSQNGTQFASSIRANQAALRDGVVMVSFRGWNLKVNGADKTQPSAWYYTNSEDTNEAMRALPTWIATGVASGQVERVLWTYTSDGWSTQVTVGAENYNYNASAIFVSSFWSL